MKHGKKSEQKSARTESKKSGKAGHSAGSPKKVVAAPRASAKSGGSKAGPAVSKVTPVARGKAAANTGAKRPVAAAANGTDFANPAIGASFHRAVKKYNNAFRRLTD